METVTIRIGGKNEFAKADALIRQAQEKQAAKPTPTAASTQRKQKHPKQKHPKPDTKAAPQPESATARRC